jgi:hypothetical protein
LDFSLIFSLLPGNYAAERIDRKTTSAASRKASGKPGAFLVTGNPDREVEG